MTSEKSPSTPPTLLPTALPHVVPPSRPGTNRTKFLLFSTLLLASYAARSYFFASSDLTLLETSEESEERGQRGSASWHGDEVGGYLNGLVAKGLRGALDGYVGVRGERGSIGRVLADVDEDEDDESDSDSDSADEEKHSKYHRSKQSKNKHPKHHKHTRGDDKHRGPKHLKGRQPPHKRITPKQAEEIFLKVPCNDSVAAEDNRASKRYTGYEHMAGTGNDHLSALFLKSEYETLLGLRVTGPSENVFDAGSVESQRATRGITDDGEEEPRVWIDTYYPIMNKPVGRKVDILGDAASEGSPRPVEWSAKLREDIVEGDPTSIYRDEVPVFHGLSISGDVTGRIIYAGYGRKRDFDALDKAGVDVKGSIALVKYGGVFRGLKIKAAQEAGAVGCLIFTDPGDDGEVTVKNGYEMYPDGPARQESSVQRGSVQFISKYPGDPATPGTPAYPNATRSELGNMPSIPSLPISYMDALPLLNTLVGQGKPAGNISADWIGGLEGEPHGLQAYWTGPGTKDVHFVNEVDTKVTPIWNTMAMIPGHIKDEVVVIGNHRDAWVLGGADPSSGTATTYEIMRGFSKLMKKGWKPLRSILVASWDAEEYGLIGSTEWCEDFGDWLRKHAVSYLNLDVSVAGTNFHGSASPSLALLLKSAAEQIEHPSDKARSLWEMQDGGDWRQFNAALGIVGSVEDEDVEDMFTSDTGIKALGSGSDYTAFLQRYGVASTDMGYVGGPSDPPYHYHSIYDSYTWQAKYADPGFHKHTAAAQMLGLMTLRVADGLVLPLNVTQYTLDLDGYLAKVKHIAETTELEETKVDFTELEEAISSVQSAALSLDEKTEATLKKLASLIPRHGHEHTCQALSLRRAWWRLKRFLMHGRGYHPRPRPFPGHLPHKKVKEIKKVLAEIRIINKKLSSFESGFLSEEGIRDREWYKHKGTAPGKWLGYGATTFPALTEALTIDNSTALAQKEANELASMINEMAKQLRA